MLLLGVCRTGGTVVSAWFVSVQDPVAKGAALTREAASTCP